MNEPERPTEGRTRTFYAFCSLLLPGLGQLLQRRVGAALGFFTLFLLSAFLPVLIVSLLFVDRFAEQPLRVHVLHLAVFGGLYFVFLLAVFWSVMDAALKPGEIRVEKPVAESGEKSRRRSHFTLIELLVVIAIVGTLILLLLPAVPSARPAARRMQCNNHMKQILLGFHNYHDEYGCFPPAYTVDEDGKPLHGWRVLVLPYIEQTALYEEIRLDEPWDSEHNRQFHSQAPETFRCPSGNPRETASVPVPAGSYYSVVVGPEAAFSGPETKSMATEGWASTIFLVECRTPVNWMDPSREMTFDAACKGVNVDAMGISSYHVNGAHVALGDGSVRFVSETVDGETLREMLTFDKESAP